jgi:hypothetical protein
MQFIKKHFEVIVLALFVISFLQECNNSGKISKLEKQTKIADTAIRKTIKAEGLRASKRTLYDWNAVVRTAVRPDDRMNEYDQEIQKLEK